MAEQSRIVAVDLDDDVATRLVDSARHLLDERGLHAVTVRSVANGAGMSTMNVYSRFGGKDGLLDVLYNEAVAQLRAEIDEVDEPVLADHLRGLAAAYRRFALAWPARYELMFGGTGRGYQPGDGSLGAARSVLEGVFARISGDVENGTIELRDGATPILVASTLWAMCHGALAFERESVGGDRLDWAAVHGTGVDALVEQFLARVDTVA